MSFGHIYLVSIFIMCIKLIGDKAARARGYKIFFMLNSGEHEILNAHKYKNIKKFSFFQTQIS